MVPDKNTTIERSFFKMLVMAIKNDKIAEVAAASAGMASFRLLKKVCPPRSPSIIKIMKTPKNAKKETASQTDTHPARVFGLK
ncbi:hypothetical protein D6817_02835 [Candidatus Pacearchaeota archaeon]|nr:MAG: hypothetical protein D6817_02835 [Candidatus Pacearchaeota archaeon]